MMSEYSSPVEISPLVDIKFIFSKIPFFKAELGTPEIPCSASVAETVFMGDEKSVDKKEYHMCQFGERQQDKHHFTREHVQNNNRFISSCLVKGKKTGDKRRGSQKENKVIGKGCDGSDLCNHYPSEEKK